MIFDKTLDIPKLIICNPSFRSSGTKQWHTLWIRKLCFKRVTDNISSIYHGLYLHHKCREFFSTDYPVSAVNIFGTGIKEMGVWCIVSISRSPQSQTKGKLWLPFAWQHETECYLHVFVTEMTLNAASLAPHQLTKYGATNNMMVTGLTFSLDTVRSIARCVTKLKLNYEHWNQYLHS